MICPAARRGFAALSVSLFALLLASCKGGEAEDAPGPPSAGEVRALSDAEEMLQTREEPAASEE